MNNLRDYYERALQEFGTSDEGEQSSDTFFFFFKEQEAKGSSVS